MKKRTDHQRVKGKEEASTRYGREYLTRTDTCDTCGFVQMLTLNKNGRSAAWDIQKWEIHVDAYDLEPLGLHRVEGSGVLLGRIHRKRGKPNELWLYHSFDPDLPTAKKGWMNKVHEVRDELLANPFTRKPAWEYRQIPWLMVHPWMLYRINQNGGQFIDQFKRREEAVAKVQDILSKEEAKGYAVESGEEIAALMDAGVEAPLADMIVYLDRFLKEALGAKSVKDIHHYLGQIADMKGQMSTIDELRRTLQERLVGGLADL